MPKITTPSTSIGLRLRQAREMSGATQEQIAAEAAVSRAALSKWEQGARVPPLDDAARLAKAISVRLAAAKKQVGQGAASLLGWIGLGE